MHYSAMFQNSHQLFHKARSQNVAGTYVSDYVLIVPMNYS